jgi:hypothetical protein
MTQHQPKATLQDFVAVYNDLDGYPTVADVLSKLSISAKTLRNKVGLCRGLAHSDEAFKLIDRGSFFGSPLSEDTVRYKEDWTAADCIKELRRVAELNPDQVITRNHFRVHGVISEATWNRYFGTFEEFSRQAGLKLTRQQHGHERSIAKHASVDHYRLLAEERKEYAGKYERIDGKRFKTMAVCSDLHDEAIDPFFLRVWLDTLKRVQPDVTVFNGDIFDLPEFGKYTVDPREWDVVGKIKFTHDKILRPTREAVGDGQIDFMEGNHEARMLRQLADATPALRSVLSDLHGFTVGKLFGLDEFGINYVAKADLASFTKRDFEKELAHNYKVYFDCFLTHHFPHARNMGLPGVNGHHHKHVVWSNYSPVFGAYEWHQLGCGHQRSASYCEGEKWHLGFAIVHIDTWTRNVNIEYVPITDHAVVGGKWYHRNATERVNTEIRIAAPALV